MMTTFRLAGFAAGCALALSLSPALAQTTAPATPPAAQQPGPATPGPDTRQMPDMEMMREMMRETMREMMGPGAMRGDRERRPGVMRPRDRQDRYQDRMARRGGMDRGAMMMMHGARRGGMHAAGMRILFAVVDTDGDGALSLPEIQEFHARVFVAVDDNGDGRVDMDEIGAFFHGLGGPDDGDDDD